MTKNAFSGNGWTADQLPDLSGKTYVITGGNSGIGFVASRLLAERGGRVIMICRSEEKAKNAVADLNAGSHAVDAEFIQGDLADLSSVKNAASQIRARCPSIDGLINNAGLMMIPKRTETKDGFETQFGVNHLGHFVLNAALGDLVEKASGRFVSVASVAHKFAPGIRFSDVMFKDGYKPGRVYAQSKLANLMYALELNRRLEGAGLKSRAFACHPGYSDTNLQVTGPGSIAAFFMRPLTMAFSQPAELGALPTVLAAASDQAAPGGYYGPTGFMDMTGPVREARMTGAAKNEQAGAKLWDLSEELTGAKWSIFERAAA
ncbi:MAG: oxidoreductase [Pseudomonadota bacterium]